MAEQADSIVRLGEPHQEGGDFFGHHREIEQTYTQQTKRFGSSFEFGGKCVVQNMYQSEYYT